ncbi:MAG TPA: hypothetical protein VKR38_16205 [Usitatibacter sp.]|nr:hypothetical protein [Usitatibacter sp.]
MRFAPGLRASVLAASMAAGAVCAGQAGSTFTVEVTLQGAEPAPPQPTSAFCHVRNMPGSYGAVVTVVCSTGTVVEIGPPADHASWLPIHGGSYRFLPPVSLAGVMSPGSDMDTGLGTVTSWRVFKVSDRDFLELTVRW